MMNDPKRGRGQGHVTYVFLNFGVMEAEVPKFKKVGHVTLTRPQREHDQGHTI